MSSFEGDLWNSPIEPINAATSSDGIAASLWAPPQTNPNRTRVLRKRQPRMLEPHQQAQDIADSIQYSLPASPPAIADTRRNGPMLPEEALSALRSYGILPTQRDISWGGVGDGGSDYSDSFSDDSDDTTPIHTPYMYHTADDDTVGNMYDIDGVLAREATSSSWLLSSGAAYDALSDGTLTLQMEDGVGIKWKMPKMPKIKMPKMPAFKMPKAHTAHNAPKAHTHPTSQKRRTHTAQATHVAKGSSASNAARHTIVTGAARALHKKSAAESAKAMARGVSHNVHADRHKTAHVAHTKHEARAKTNAGIHKRANVKHNTASRAAHTAEDAKLSQHHNATHAAAKGVSDASAKHVAATKKVMETHTAVQKKVATHQAHRVVHANAVKHARDAQTTSNKHNDPHSKKSAEAARATAAKTAEAMQTSDHDMKTAAAHHRAAHKDVHKTAASLEKAKETHTVAKKGRDDAHKAHAENNRREVQKELEHHKQTSESRRVDLEHAHSVVEQQREQHQKVQEDTKRRHADNTAGLKGAHDAEMREASQQHKQRLRQDAQGHQQNMDETRRRDEEKHQLELDKGLRRHEAALDEAHDANDVERENHERQQDTNRAELEATKKRHDEDMVKERDQRDQSEASSKAAMEALKQAHADELKRAQVDQESKLEGARMAQATAHAHLASMKLIQDRINEETYRHEEAIKRIRGELDDTGNAEGAVGGVDTPVDDSGNAVLLQAYNANTPMTQSANAQVQAINSLDVVSTQAKIAASIMGATGAFHSTLMDNLDDESRGAGAVISEHLYDIAGLTMKLASAGFGEDARCVAECASNAFMLNGSGNLEQSEVAAHGLYDNLLVSSEIASDAVVEARDNLFELAAGVEAAHVHIAAIHEDTDAVNDEIGGLREPEDGVSAHHDLVRTAVSASLVSGACIYAHRCQTATHIDRIAAVRTAALIMHYSE